MILEMKHLEGLVLITTTTFMEKLNKVSLLIIIMATEFCQMNSLRNYCHFFSCAALSNGVSGEDGALFDRRTGRRGKRQKNSTKLVAGKYESLPSEKENVEAGQVQLKDGLQGEDN